jgi:hypothetical protein
MTNEIIIHAAEFQNEAEYIQSEVESNITGKLDAYIRRTAKEWSSEQQGSSKFHSQGMPSDLDARTIPSSMTSSTTSSSISRSRWGSRR